MKLRSGEGWGTVICDHLVSWIKQLSLFIYIPEDKSSFIHYAALQQNVTL